MKDILSREWLAGAAIWNLNDFYSERRSMSQPHVNNKGLTTLTRETAALKNMIGGNL